LFATVFIWKLESIFLRESVPRFTGQVKDLFRKLKFKFSNFFVALSFSLSLFLTLFTQAHLVDMFNIFCEIRYFKTTALGNKIGLSSNWNKFLLNFIAQERSLVWPPKLKRLWKYVRLRHGLRTQKRKQMVLHSSQASQASIKMVEEFRFIEIALVEESNGELI